jgi:hypothetical protein
VNSEEFEIHPSIASSGALHFCSGRSGGMGGGDIYRSRYVDGRYAEPENLGDMINSEYGEGDIYIAPDESYIIYSSGRPGGLGRNDLYVSYRRPDGTWSQAINMGPKSNSPYMEYCPCVSPDGKYLFFTSYRRHPRKYDSAPMTYDEMLAIYKKARNGLGDIYWADSSVIEELKADQSEEDVK